MDAKGIMNDWLGRNRINPASCDTDRFADLIGDIVDRRRDVGEGDLEWAYDATKYGPTMDEIVGRYGRPIAQFPAADGGVVRIHWAGLFSYVAILETDGWRYKVIPPEDSFGLSFAHFEDARRRIEPMLAR